MSSQRRDRHILFFKTIEENSLRHGELRIPRGFVSEYWEGMSNPIFLLLPNGAKWEVTWKKHGADVWLTNDWKNFAKFYSLDQGHLLVFTYERRSRFQVLIFDQGGLEIRYPLPQASLDDGTEENDQSVNSFENFDGFSRRQGKRPKSPIPFSHSSKKMKTFPREKPKCYPRHDLETTNKCQSQRSKLEMERFHADFDNTKSKNKGGRGIMHTNRGCSKSEASESEEPLKGTESRNALERANAFQAECENRSFIRQMRPSYIDRNLLVMPGNFITARQQKENESATLLVDGVRKIWDVKFKLNPCNGQISLSTGWKKFVDENHLKLDDVCVFEQMESEGVSFKVAIFRAREESTPPRFQAHGHGDELQNNFAERDCGRTAKKCSRYNVPRNNSSIMSENDFTLSIKPTQLSAYYMNIPMEFIRKYVVDEGAKDVTLRVGERSWPVRLDIYPQHSYARFSKGWPAFVGDVNLKAGDVCLFKLVDKDKFVIQVTVSRHVD